jgi:hypothetical protein
LSEAEFYTDGADFSPLRLTTSLTRMLLQAARSTALRCSQETVKLMARNAIGDLGVPMVRSNPALALEARHSWASQEMGADLPH